MLEREGNTKVGDQGMAALQQDVLRLHVAVHDAMAVRIIERIRHLAHQLQGIVDGEATFAREARTERLPFDERHDIPHKSLRASGVEQRNDVRVLERRGDPDLLEEPLCPDGCRELLTEHLYRDPAVMPQVSREVHSGHATASNLALELVAPRQCGRKPPGERCWSVAGGQLLGGWPVEEVAGAIVRSEQ